MVLTTEEIFLIYGYYLNTKTGEIVSVDYCDDVIDRISEDEFYFIMKEYIHPKYHDLVIKFKVMKKYEAELLELADKAMKDKIMQKVCQEENKIKKVLKL